jgi:hypothetical protein
MGSPRYWCLLHLDSPTLSQAVEIRLSSFRSIAPTGAARRRRPQSKENRAMRNPQRFLRASRNYLTAAHRAEKGRASQRRRRALRFENLEERRLLAQLTWIGGSTGTWSDSITATNWSNGTNNVPWVAGDTAVFKTNCMVRRRA